MRRIIAIDTETWRILPGCPVPPMVCLSYAQCWADGSAIEEDAFEFHGLPSRFSDVLKQEDGLRFFEAALRAAIVGDVTLVLLNGPYDLSVLVHEAQTRRNWHVDLLPLVFAAYKRGSLRDLKERQKLIDLADGDMKYARDPETGEFKKSEYSLAALSKRLLGIKLQKEDTWRLKYALLDDVPIGLWPQDAYEYALSDAESTLGIYLEQRKFAGPWSRTTSTGEHKSYEASPVVTIDGDGDSFVINEKEQLRAGWALRLMSAWGIRTDGDAVERLDEDLRKKQIKAREQLKATTIYKYHTFIRGKNAGKTKVSKNMKEITRRIVEAYATRGEEPPMTDGTEKSAPKVSTSADTMRKSTDSMLKIVADIAETDKLLSTYVPILKHGSKYPINALYNLIVESGRTSCARPNMQNPPRMGGVRECFIPRTGYMFVSVDYDQLEMCTLAQTILDWFGSSSMADAINSGRDLHLDLASEILGITYEEAEARSKIAKKAKKTMTKEEFKASGLGQILDMRQFAKIPNFGKPGGMGDISLVDFAYSTYKIVISLTPEPDKPGQSAQELSASWAAKWPEMADYFGAISDMIGPLGEAAVRQDVSGRVRGGVSYCAACNTFFQGRAADGAKLALWNVAWECYVGTCYDDVTKPSPLYGTRPVIFMHDEIIAEIPEANLHAAAERLSRVMIESMKVFVPDVNIGASPAAMPRWYKEAETARDADGLLIPWVPKQEEKRAA